MTGARARRALAGAALASTVLTAAPSGADENTRLHSAGFTGTGVVEVKDGSATRVVVRAEGAQCNVVVVTGLQSTVVPGCSFLFEATVETVEYCTGTAEGYATLTVTLPEGVIHTFAYQTVAIVDETTIHGFGTDSSGGAARTGWVMFDAAPPKCGEHGFNVGAALY